MLSIRGRRPDGGEEVVWDLVTGRAQPPKATLRDIWPRPDERGHGTRHPIAAPVPDPSDGLWVARADALPSTWEIPPDRLVWSAGVRTWERLAARGVWVHGCADGLGMSEPTDIELLAGRPSHWRRLTHAAAGVPGALATYVVDEPLPDDLSERSHFFWTSGTLFHRAVERWPRIRAAWHATGPGSTRRVVETAIGDTRRVGVWLDYDAWYREVLR